MPNKTFDGYVETDNGLSKLQIIISENGEWSVWENDDLRDDIDELDQIVEVFGDQYFATKDHFKRDLPDSITEWLEDNV